MIMAKTLPLPTRPSFWRAWLAEPVEIHGMMEPGAISDAISEVINREISCAAQAAAVIWYLVAPEWSDRAELAISAAERWLDLIEIAADESQDPEAARKVLLQERVRWAEVESKFAGFGP